MNCVARCLLIALTLLAGACATTVAPTHDYPSGTPVILDVPFVAQVDLNCGPAALTSVLRYYGAQADVDTLRGQVFSPRAHGSLTIEVGAAPRRYGFVSYPLPHRFSALIEEIAAGRPVLVLQNLGLSWLPQWHYATVVGFDPATDELLLHSGATANYRIARRTFIATWARADYWARVITPPSQIPASAQPLEYLEAINALEQTGHTQEAADAYQTAARHFTDHATTQLVAANALMAAGDAAGSHALFMAALRISPNNAITWNNFAYALKQSDCEISARKAIAIARDLAPLDANIRASENELNNDSDVFVQRVDCPQTDELELVAMRIRR
jgi:tetratricopeptide (TPR) repeat protein